ncbi:MAG TPA: EamA family transporter [Holophagaceae bacterium]|nr:EamA family transporter [Holophagaceae bacterium]
MRASILFAILAGCAWGAGGYFEKAGLKVLGLPPLAGITVRTMVALLVLGSLSFGAWKGVGFEGKGLGWAMLIIGGGIVAGSLGMWSFYKSLSLSHNLGVTLALAFACSPLAGTALGLVKGDQPMNRATAAGLLTIVVGIVVLQLGKVHPAASR